MPETDPEYMHNVFVKIDKGEREDELCSILRALLCANHQSNGQATTNRQFRQGVIIEFGAGPSARDFIEAVRFFLKKVIRRRVILELRG